MTQKSPLISRLLLAFREGTRSFDIGDYEDVVEQLTPKLAENPSFPYIRMANDDLIVAIGRDRLNYELHADQLHGPNLYGVYTIVPSPVYPYEVMTAAKLMTHTQELLVALARPEDKDAVDTLITNVKNTLFAPTRLARAAAAFNLPLTPKIQ